jgi:hypothetical protein
VTEDIETSTPQPPADDSPTAAGAPSAPQRAAAIVDERPEVAVGAAFAGGLLFALILKRVAR